METRKIDEILFPLCKLPSGPVADHRGFRHYLDICTCVPFCRGRSELGTELDSHQTNEKLAVAAIAYRINRR
jgi:hypothetical protein